MNKKKESKDPKQPPVIIEVDQIPFTQFVKEYCPGLEEYLDELSDNITITIKDK